MSDTGWVSPGTVVSDSSVGTVAWNNPSNATTSNDTYTTIGKYICISEYLKATNFSFNIPSEATIDGIEARYEKRHASTDNITDEYLRIVKSNGTFGTENKADTSTPWTAVSDTYTEYGGSSDLWGETWSASDINDVDFGVALSIDNDNSIAWVDHIQIKVYYTATDTPTVGVKYPLPAFKRP